jgi:hypothetical protein
LTSALSIFDCFNVIPWYPDTLQTRLTSRIHTRRKTGAIAKPHDACCDREKKRQEKGKKKDRMETPPHTRKRAHAPNQSSTTPV